MVWQEDVNQIIMLTNLKEGRKVGSDLEKNIELYRVFSKPVVSMLFSIAF